MVMVRIRTTQNEPAVILLVYCKRVLDGHHPQHGIPADAMTLLGALQAANKLLPQTSPEQHSIARAALATAATRRKYYPADDSSLAALRRYDAKPRHAADRIAACWRAIDSLNIPDTEKQQ